jgi:hypothetical protein
MAFYVYIKVEAISGRTARKLFRIE